MLTELQKKRLLHMFHLLDHDGNGFLEYKDFDGIFQNVVKLQGLGPGSEYYKKLEFQYKERWEVLQSLADTNKDGRVSPDEWLQYYDPLLASAEKVEQFLENFVGTLFDIFDRDGNGGISLGEYKKLMQAYGVKSGVAEQVFPKYDVNKNGELDRDEVLTLVRQFYLSDNPDDPGNDWFGPCR